MLKNQILLSVLALAVSVLSMSVTLAAPKLNGVAVHNELGSEQFIAGLYVETPSSSARTILLANEPKKMHVHITADRLSSRRFKRLWIEGMAINASTSELEKQAENMAAFSNLLKVKLIKGDRFVVDRDLKETRILVNGTMLGSINDPTFFDLLLRTWIGPVPLSSDFRASMLASGDVDSDMLARFNSVRPSQQRIAAVKNAIEEANKPPEPQVAANEPKPEEKKKPPVSIKPPTPTPTPPPVAVAPPKPKEPKVTKAPEPKKPKSIPKPPEELVDESIFDDETDELDFTAESLLSQQLYIRKLKQWSQKFLRYPPRAFERNQQGHVRIGVTINRKGRVTDVEVLEEAEYDALTYEAKSAVKRASPFPPMPDDVTGESFNFAIPVNFKIVVQD